MAECSLSTGRISMPFSLAVFMTSEPPATSVSLFASAICFLALSAVKVGLRPTMPTTEFKTISTLSSSVRAQRPSMPLYTFTLRSRTAARSLEAASKSKTATACGLNFRICSSRSRILEWAASASTLTACSPSFCIQRTTSSACVPMDPVEPSKANFFMQTHPFLRHDRQQHRYHVDKRCGENHAVETVQNTAVARNDAAEIFDVAASFNERKAEVAEHGHKRAEKADD